LISGILLLPMFLREPSEKGMKDSAWWRIAALPGSRTVQRTMLYLGRLDQVEIFSPPPFLW
jgi:hypothetical protein